MEVVQLRQRVVNTAMLDWSTSIPSRRVHGSTDY